MQSGHCAKIRQLGQQLESKLIASSVARVLYQRDALTMSELETILRLHEEPSRAAQYLLGDILEHSPRPVFDCFMEVLKETGQQDVYMLLSCSGWQLLGIGIVRSDI